MRKRIFIATIALTATFCNIALMAQDSSGKYQTDTEEVAHAPIAFGKTNNVIEHNHTDYKSEKS